MKPADTHRSSELLGMAWLMAFVAGLPFDRFYSELALIGLALHTLIQYRRGQAPGLSWPTILILQSVFFLTVLSTVHTSYPGQAFSFWTKQLAILLLPLVLAFTRFDLRQALRPILMTLVVTCCFSLAYCYLEAVRVLVFYHLPLRDLLSDRFLNHRFSEPIGLHATYFSLYCALAALVLLTRMRRPGNWWKQCGYGLLLFLLLAGLLQLGSRAILIAVLLIGAGLYPAFELEKQQQRRYFLFALPLLALTLLFVMQTASLRHRLFTDLQADLARERGEPLLGSRAERWSIAWELVRAKPLTGWGAGDEVKELKERYYARGLYSAYIHDLNAHNQYLSFLVKSGIPGLLVYLLTLGYGFRLAWRRRDFLLTGFLVLISIVSVSENILDVNKGIFFYAFFLPLFIAAGQKKQRKLLVRGNRVEAQLVSTS